MDIQTWGPVLTHRTRPGVARMLELPPNRQKRDPPYWGESLERVETDFAQNLLCPQLAAKRERPRSDKPLQL